MRLYTLDAPAHWACFLINGDNDSLDAIEHRECAAWLTDNALSANNCVDAGEEFMGRFDFNEQGNLLTILATYTFLMKEDTK